MASEVEPKCPPVTWRYVGDALELWWRNPWNGTEERIASFWWPAHPIEATAQAEEWFETIAARACTGADDAKR